VGEASELSCGFVEVGCSGVVGRLEEGAAERCLVPAGPELGQVPVCDRLDRATAARVGPLAARVEALEHVLAAVASCIRSGDVETALALIRAARRPPCGGA
jgi:hypothetical protein